MHADPLALGQRIAGLRRARGWSQGGLAEAAGVSHGYVALVELGRLASPGKFRLDAVAHALNLRTSDALLGQQSAVIGPPSHALPPGGNVVGGLDQVRPLGARPLPVFRWGSCGDPRDRENSPDPDHLEFPPPGRETLIGPAGFGVVVKGESMAARGIFDGDAVGVNPDGAYQLGKVGLALVTDGTGHAGLAAKTHPRTHGARCPGNATVDGRTPVVW